MLSFLFSKQLLFTAAKENAYYKHQGSFKIKKQLKSQTSCKLKYFNGQKGFSNNGKQYLSSVLNVS